LRSAQKCLYRRKKSAIGQAFFVKLFGKTGKEALGRESDNALVLEATPRGLGDTRLLKGRGLNEGPAGPHSGNISYLVGKEEVCGERWDNHLPEKEKKGPLALKKGNIEPFH